MIASVQAAGSDFSNVSPTCATRESTSLRIRYSETSMSVTCTNEDEGARAVSRWLTVAAFGTSFGPLDSTLYGLSTSCFHGCPRGEKHCCKRWESRTSL